MTRSFRQPDAPSPRTTYDAIVVGSGAAGGMTAFTLAQAGLTVLVLEAGRSVDPNTDFKTMEWPYDTPRRGGFPPDEYEISMRDYREGTRPIGWVREFDHYTRVWGPAARSETKHLMTDERDMPYTGTPYVWTRVRALGGKTLIWGRVALRLSDYDLKAKSHDGYGDDWPLSYADLAPYYDRVDRLLGISGTVEKLPQLPDGIFQRPIALNCGERILQAAARKMGRHVIPGRAGVTTDGLLHNRYRARCMGRGRCGNGCDISASFHSPTALLFPARDTGHCTIRPDSVVAEVLYDPGTNRATGVRAVDRRTKEPLEFRAKAVVVAASTIESTRLLLNSKSRTHPDGLANSSGVLGRYLCEHFMVTGAHGHLPMLAGRETTNDDGRPTSMYLVRFRNITDRHPDFIRGYQFQGGAGCGQYPGVAHGVPGFGASFKRAVREKYPTPIGMTGFGEVLAHRENYVDVDPRVTDAWGIPVARFHYGFGDNERKMAKDIAATAGEMLEAAGAREVQVDEDILLEGASIHELGTARMGTDPKSSVTNPFGRTHDVPNLYVLDGSLFVSAACQNPTWTILALAMRGSDHLVEQFRTDSL